MPNKNNSPQFRKRLQTIIDLFKARQYVPCAQVVEHVQKAAERALRVPQQDWTFAVDCGRSALKLGIINATLGLPGVGEFNAGLNPGGAELTKWRNAIIHPVLLSYLLSPCLESPLSTKGADRKGFWFWLFDTNPCTPGEEQSAALDRDYAALCSCVKLINLIYTPEMLEMAYKAIFRKDQGHITVSRNMHRQPPQLDSESDGSGEDEESNISGAWSCESDSGSEHGSEKGYDSMDSDHSTDKRRDFPLPVIPSRLVKPLPRRNGGSAQ